jgi:hypothetical protein
MDEMPMNPSEVKQVLAEQINQSENDVQCGRSRLTGLEWSQIEALLDAACTAIRQ